VDALATVTPAPQDPSKVLLAKAAIFGTLIYVAVRFGVPDGMADFEKRKRDETRDPNL
jgi:hypothetical protein